MSLLLTAALCSCHFCRRITTRLRLIPSPLAQRPVTTSPRSSNLTSASLPRLRFAASWFARLLVALLLARLCLSPSHIPRCFGSPLLRLAVSPVPRNFFAALATLFCLDSLPLSERAIASLHRLCFYAASFPPLRFPFPACRCRRFLNGIVLLQLLASAAFSFPSLELGTSPILLMDNSAGVSSAITVIMKASTHPGPPLCFHGEKTTNMADVQAERVGATGMAPDWSDL